MDLTDALAIALGASIVGNLLLFWAMRESQRDLACAMEVIDLIEEKAHLP